MFIMTIVIMSILSDRGINYEKSIMFVRNVLICIIKLKDSLYFIRTFKIFKCSSQVYETTINLHF